MRTTHRPPHAARPLALLLVAGLAATLAAPPMMPQRALAMASTMASTTNSVSRQPTVTGRDFAGLKLGLPLQVGPMRLSAARVNAWEQAASVVPGTANSTFGTTVRRLLLRGDVRVDIAGTPFSAARAAVWIEELGPSKAMPNNPAARQWQIAVYFDRVSDPAAEVGALQAADRLLVTAQVDGEAALLGDSVLTENPEGDAFVAEADRRLANFLSAALAAEEAPAGAPRPAEAEIPAAEMAPSESPLPTSLILPGRTQPFEPDSPFTDPVLARGLTTSPDQLTTPGGLAERGDAPLFTRGGVFTVAAGEPTLVMGQNGAESSVVITGGVVVNYADQRQDRNLQISADKAVIFIKGGRPQDLARAGIESVLGVYVEGNVVATDGRYTIRAPQVYYDVVNNRAELIDAVFWTYDQNLGLPLYVRAKAIRQNASQRLEATDVRVSSSAFFTPHLSLGAKNLTIARDVPAGQIARTIIKGEGITANFGDMPFFWWPGFEGDLQRFPLRDVTFGNSSRTGFGARTRWDLFGILGVDAPRTVDAELQIDGYSKRGLGLGGDLTWGDRTSDGRLYGYMLPDDNGTDQLTSGLRVDREGGFRGVALGEARWRLGGPEYAGRTGRDGPGIGTVGGWMLLAEGSSISDENFIDAYFPTLAETRREFTTAGEIRGANGNSALSLRIQNNFNDFTPNEYLLQSQGYDVSRLPEARYSRVGDDLLPGVAPGALTWNQDYRVGLMRLNFTEATARQLGFDTPERAQAAFGLQPDQTLAERLGTQGLTEDSVFRAQTRQELTSTFKLGPVTLTPFAVARAAFYSEDFAAVSQAAGVSDTDELVYSASGGMRAATQLQRIDDAAKSDLLGIDRIRHIIEPSVTIWASGASRPSRSLPVYDANVESLAEGGAVRAGVNQTWQTQRGGGPDGLRTVDVFKLNADLVYSGNNAQQTSPIGRFIEFAPEYSQLGEFAVVDGAWQATDSLAVIASTTYDLDLQQQARTTTGLRIDHSADFSTFAEMRYINPRDVTYVDLGAELRFTPKYVVAASTTYDTNQGEFQSVAARVTREFPDLSVGALVRYDAITDDVGLGFEFRPIAQDFRRRQLERLNRSRIDPGLGELPDAPNRAGFFGSGDSALSAFTGPRGPAGGSGAPTMFDPPLAGGR